MSLGWYWVGLKRITKFNKILNMVQILIFFYFILLSACLSGYSGINCTKKCPFPTYGHRCQKLCKCNKEQCNVSTGCTLLFDGIFIFFLSLLNVNWVFLDSNINLLNTRIVKKKFQKCIISNWYKSFAFWRNNDSNNGYPWIELTEWKHHKNGFKDPYTIELHKYEIINRK